MDRDPFWNQFQSNAEHMLGENNVIPHFPQPQHMGHQPPLMFHPGMAVGSQVPPRPSGRVKQVCTRIKQQNFSPEEDKKLVTCWLGVSCDPIISTGQKKDKFWQRITDAYNKNLGAYPERTPKSLSSRWEGIKEQSNKFKGFYNEVLRRNPSGMTDADKTTQAADVFTEVEKHPFKFLHVWNLLKDEPKWMEVKPKGTCSAAAHSADDGEESNPLNLDPESESPESSKGKRPVGRDASKRAAKKGSSSSVGSAGSEEFASKMHDLSVDRLTFYKDVESTRTNTLAQMATIEEQKFESREKHRQQQLELEKSRLAIEQETLAMRKQEAETRAQDAATRRQDSDLRKQELEQRRQEQEMIRDEKILSFNLDTCSPVLREYYLALQEEVMAKIRTRRSGQ